MNAWMDECNCAQEREASTSLREAQLREEMATWAAERAMAAEQDTEARRKADKELVVSLSRAGLRWLARLYVTSIQASSSRLYTALHMHQCTQDCTRCMC